MNADIMLKIIWQLERLKHEHGVSWKIEGAQRITVTWPQGRSSPSGDPETLTLVPVNASGDQWRVILLGCAIGGVPIQALSVCVYLVNTLLLKYGGGAAQDHLSKQ